MRSNRWFIAVAGTIAMACLGTVYSWSLYTQPLVAAFGWSSTTTTWAFALAIFFLGVGAILGGRWQDRSGPRPVVVTGALLWGIGNVLAGLGTARLGAPWIYATYGVLGGLGLGLGYAVSDRIGRNLAYLLIYGSQVIIFFAVGGVHPLPLVALLFAIVLLGYGGGFGTMPSREEGSRWRHLLPPRRAHA